MLYFKPPQAEADLAVVGVASVPLEFTWPTPGPLPAPEAARRRFNMPLRIGAAVLALAIGVGTYLVGREDGSNNSQQTIEQMRRDFETEKAELSEPDGTEIVYRSGQELPTPVSARVEGWSLVIDPSDAPPDANVRFSMRYSERVKSSITVKDGKLEADSASMVPLGDNKATIRLLPVPYGGQSSDVVCEYTQDGKPVRKVFAIEPTVYVPEGGSNGSDQQDIISEIPLTAEAAKLVNDFGNIFNPFLSSRRVYVHNEKGFPANPYPAVYDSEDDSLHIASEMLTDTAYADQNAIKLWEAYSTALFIKLQSDTYNPSGNAALYNAHKTLVGAPNADLLLGMLNPKGYTDLTKDFAATNTTYNHLFVNALTVMRFFPRQFLEKASNLPQAERRVLRETLDSVGSALREVEGLEEPNAAISALLPDLLRVQNALN